METVYYTMMIPVTAIRFALAYTREEEDGPFPEGWRDEVLAWLRTVLVDVDARLFHEEFLRAEMRADMGTTPETSKLRTDVLCRREPLAEGRADDVCTEGVEALTDPELVDVLLDTLTLDFLAEVIDDQRPPAWEPLLAKDDARLVELRSKNKAVFRVVLGERAGGHEVGEGQLSQTLDDPSGTPAVMSLGGPSADDEDADNPSWEFAVDEGRTEMEVMWDEDEKTLYVSLTGRCAMGPGNRVAVRWLRSDQEIASEFVENVIDLVRLVSSEPPHPGDALEVSWVRVESA